MRQFACKVVVVAFMLSLTAPLLQTSFRSGSAEAQTAPPTDPSIWSENIDIVDEGAISEAEASQDPQCTSVSLRRRVYNGILLTLPNGKKLHPYGSTATVDAGEGCAVSNKLGSFANGLYAPSGNLSNSLKLNRTSVSYLPAPASEFVIKKVRSSSSGLHAISISSNLQNGELTYKKVNSLSYDLTWTPKNPTNSIRFALNGVPSSGPRVTAKDIAFSRNGKFMIAKLAAGVFARVDLRTQAMTPVYRSLEKSNGGTKTAISNDGRYAFTGNSKEVFLHDIASCDITYQKGYWELNQDMASYGCDKTENLKRPIQAKTSRAPRGFVYPQFSLNSSELSYVDQRSSSQNHRISLRANDYVSSAEGYLALGDSFSSGEGDNDGDVWYEPGTDEQGSTSTFEGRNLCHLSRRSYPYLMAVELGYLATNSTTPPSDGLFHSVACSGAWSHNVTGGEKKLFIGSGTKDLFKETDNQYINNFGGTLGHWQPGRIKQLDIFEAESFAGYREEQSPEVVTLGIGGNDVDFGGIVESCTIKWPETCKYAVPGSDSAASLAGTIANLKPALIKTYNSVKGANPDARLYVHGYPLFVQGYNGNCGVNVALNEKETALVEEGVTYMNQIVKSAAAEAGVFYVDVSDILQGTNLCSYADKSLKTVNGATKGNDKGGLEKEWLAGVFSGLYTSCILSTGCVGNESYHPNEKAHPLYAQAIMNQTANLTASMPLPIKTPTPLPDAFFGVSIRDAIQRANVEKGYISNYITIQEPRRFLQYSDSPNTLRILQDGLLPGSTLQVWGNSDPVLIGEYTVPENGEIDIEITLPSVITEDPGVHEIHLLGANAFSEEIDYYESLQLAFSSDDFDGDGVLNTEDSCLRVQNSFIDADTDSIDDACDSSVVLQEAVIDNNEENNPDQPDANITAGQEDSLIDPQVLSAQTGSTSLQKTGSEHGLIAVLYGVTIILASWTLAKVASRD